MPCESLRLRTNLFGNFGARADGNKLTTPNGNGFGCPPCGSNRNDVSTGKNQIRGLTQCGDWSIDGKESEHSGGPKHSERHV